MAQTASLQPTAGVAPLTVSIPVGAEKLPPSEPTVTYENDLLTITASNSTLGDILRAVSAKTGAEIEIPSQAEERVAMSLGPGSAREVIASLLTGSQFNYVLVGSDSDSKALTRILLFVRPRPENSAQTPLPLTQANAHIAQTSETETALEGVQLPDNPSDPTLPARAQQQMLQQRRQSVMQQFHQSTSTR
jgi:hypothetical protein